MTHLAAASVAAFLALTSTSHMAADAVNARASRVEMAQAQTAPEIWFIKGAVTLDGKTDNTQFMVRDEEGRPALLTFESKEQCEDVRVNDEDIAGTLREFIDLVDKRGGSVVVSCERWEHPVQ